MNALIGCAGVGPCPALGRQLPAQQHPRADYEGDADNHRRSECGKILQHRGHLDPWSAAIRSGGAGSTPAGATGPQCPYLALYPAGARYGHATNPSQACHGTPGPAAGRPGSAGDSVKVANFQQVNTGEFGRSQPEQHARVAQDVRLDPVQIEELRDPIVVRTQQLGVDLRRHWRSADFGESVTGEEGHGEGQHEYALDAKVPPAVKQLIDDQVTDALAPLALVNRDGADLGEILPHNVERSASGNRAVGGTLGDAELLDVLVEIHGVLV